MRIPYSWLKNYVDIDLPPEELAERLTLAGLAVDSVERFGLGAEGVVVAEVKAMAPLPGTEHLWVLQVDAGHAGSYQVVTGAQNVVVGARVPLALPGAVLPGGQTIETTRFRGVESQGMLCSVRELGLTEDGPEEAGILILTGEATLGADINTVLGSEEVVFVLDITPNRPDCLSIIGVAREVAAIAGGKVKLPCTEVPESPGDITEHLTISIADPDLCFRYAARVLTDINIEPSPAWMQQRLRAAGMRPINNIVDVTNYVMLETGQPLHAFDYTRLAERQIIVRRARPGEKLLTLDGSERILSEEMLVIADAKEPVGLAGIMGGLMSEITSETTTVMLEAAAFHNINVRRTAKSLGMRTEASSRFERGVDPGGVVFALERACNLVQELGAGKVMAGRIDLYPRPVTPWEVEIRPERIRQLIGAPVSDDFMRSALRRLHLELVRETEDRLVVQVPTFRPDLQLEADFVEEIARLYGFSKIPATTLDGFLQVGKKPFMMQIEDKVKEILRGCGLDEVQTYSFVNPNELDKLGLKDTDCRRRLVSLLHPLTEEQSVMRTTLLPSLLEVAALNQRRKRGPVNIFEVNRVYWPKDLPLTELPDMPRHLVVVLAGPREEATWQYDAQDNDFYRIKGLLETLVDLCKITGKFLPSTEVYYHPGRQARFTVGNQDLATLGELHPDVIAAFELSGRVYALELDLERFGAKANLTPRFKPWPRFPGVERDLALLVPEAMPAEEVQATILATGAPLLTSVELFDLYTGEQVPRGFKSLAYSLVFQAPDRTLTEEEVEPVLVRIVRTAEDKLGAKVRS
jgi:phenylalanyl-tRNA synthetase beta chain